MLAIVLLKQFYLSKYSDAHKFLSVLFLTFFSFCYRVAQGFSVSALQSNLPLHHLRRHPGAFHYHRLSHVPS